MGKDQVDGRMAERLKQLEELTVGRARPSDGTEGIPVNTPPVGLVPVPRRSRIFLRSGRGSGEGTGGFADLTVTAPVARS